MGDQDLTQNSHFQWYQKLIDTMKNKEEQILNDIKEEDEDNIVLDTDPKIKELQENKELNSLREKFKEFLDFQELGKGGFGSVNQYYDIITRRKLAKKSFHSLEAYVQERDAYLKIYERIPRQRVDRIIAPLVKMNYESKSLYFETGICSLHEFYMERMRIGVSLFGRQQELDFLFAQTIEYVLMFHKASMYHGDLKASNYVLFKNGLYDDFYHIKLIDLGGLQFSHHWNKHQMGTPSYFPPENDPAMEQIGYNPFKNRQSRLMAELYQVARMIQEIMLTSVYYSSKREYDLRYENLRNFLSQVFRNSRKCIFASFEILRHFYDDKYLQLLRYIFELDDKNLEQIYTRARTMGRESSFQGIQDEHKIAADLEADKRSKFIEKMSHQDLGSLKKFEENIDFFLRFDQVSLAIRKIQHKISTSNLISNKTYFNLIHSFLKENDIMRSFCFFSHSKSQDLQIDLHMKKYLHNYLECAQANSASSQFDFSIHDYNILIGICINSFLGQILKILSQGVENEMNLAINEQFSNIFQEVIKIEETGDKKIKLKKAYLLSMIGQVWDNSIQKDSNLPIEMRLQCLRTSTQIYKSFMDEVQQDPALIEDLENAILFRENIRKNYLKDLQSLTKTLVFSDYEYVSIMQFREDLNEFIRQDIFLDQQLMKRQDFEREFQIGESQNFPFFGEAEMKNKFLSDPNFENFDKIWQKQTGLASKIEKIETDQDFMRFIQMRKKAHPDIYLSDYVRWKRIFIKFKPLFNSGDLDSLRNLILETVKDYPVETSIQGKIEVILKAKGLVESFNGLVNLKSYCVKNYCLSMTQLEIAEREAFQFSENNMDYSNALSIRALLLTMDQVEGVLEERLEEAQRLIERSLRIKMILNGQRSADYLINLYYLIHILRKRANYSEVAKVQKYVFLNCLQKNTLSLEMLDEQILVQKKFKYLINSTSKPLVYASQVQKNYDDTKGNEEWYIRQNLDESTKIMMTSNEPILIYLLSKLDIIVPSHDRPTLNPSQISLIPDENEAFEAYLELKQTEKLDLSAQWLSLVRNILILKRKHQIPYNEALYSVMFERAKYFFLSYTIKVITNPQYQENFEQNETLLKIFQELKKTVKATKKRQVYLKYQDFLWLARRFLDMYLFQNRWSSFKKFKRIPGIQILYSLMRKKNIFGYQSEEQKLFQALFYEYVHLMTEIYKRKRDSTKELKGLSNKLEGILKQAHYSSDLTTTLAQIKARESVILTQDNLENQKVVQHTTLHTSQLSCQQFLHNWVNSKIKIDHEKKLVSNAAYQQVQEKKMNDYEAYQQNLRLSEELLELGNYKESIGILKTLIKYYRSINRNDIVKEIKNRLLTHNELIKIVQLGLKL